MAGDGDAEVDDDDDNGSDNVAVNGDGDILCSDADGCLALEAKTANAMAAN